LFTCDKPKTATDALVDLSFMAYGKPGTIGELTGLVRAELERKTEVDAEQRELFLAVYMLLAQRQRGGITKEAWERLWHAGGALMPHYGITSADDIAALEAKAKADNPEETSCQ
jgi:hypothetical protein